MPPRYTDEFRMDAVKQVVENGYGVMETAQRLGIHHDSLRNWIKKGPIKDWTLGEYMKLY